MSQVINTNILDDEARIDEAVFFAQLSRGRSPVNRASSRSCSTAVACEITTPHDTDRINLGTETITAPIWIDLSGESPPADSSGGEGMAAPWSGSIDFEPSV